MRRSFPNTQLLLFPDMNNSPSKSEGKDESVWKFPNTQYGEIILTADWTQFGSHEATVIANIYTSMYRGGRVEGLCDWRVQLGTLVCNRCMDGW